MRLIPVLLPSLATALVAPARPLTVTPARLAPLQAGAVADAEKLKVAPKLESPPVDSSGTLPKVNGGIVIGTRKLAVVTGASSGLGLYGALSLAKRGDYYVILACRNVERAERIASLCVSYAIVFLGVTSIAFAMLAAGDAPFSELSSDAYAEWDELEQEAIYQAHKRKLSSYSGDRELLGGAVGKFGIAASVEGTGGYTIPTKQFSFAVSVSGEVCLFFCFGVSASIDTA